MTQKSKNANNVLVLLKIVLTLQAAWKILGSTDHTLKNTGIDKFNQHLVKLVMCKALY